MARPRKYSVGEIIGLVISYVNFLEGIIEKLSVLYVEKYKCRV